MKTILLAPLLLLITVLALPADTIVLKDGTTYEGTILSETATSYEMRVQITSSIKDLKTIQKSDVASATRSTPDDEAFKAIGEILPVPDRQSVTRYDELIKGQVKPFLAAFPKSKHKAKANEILATLEKERAQVARGDLKLDGRWISSQDRESNAYEIDARVVFGDMESYVEAARYKEALRKYDEIKRDFANSSYYEKAAELAGKVLRTYGPAVSALLSRVDAEITQRKAEMERLPAGQRSATLAEIEREDAAYLALVEREKSELKTRWLTLNTYQKRPLEQVQRNITSATQELERIDFSKLVDAAPLYRKAWAAVTSGDEEQTKEALRELKSARIPARYVEGLEKMITDAEAARVAAEQAAEAAAAAARKAAAEEATKAMAAEEAAKAEEEAAAADSASGAETSGTAGDGDPSTPAGADEEEAGGISIKTILVAVMIVVLLVALGAMLFGKKKK